MPLPPCFLGTYKRSTSAFVDRLYVPGKQGGRGLMQLEAAHAVEITKHYYYFYVLPGRVFCSKKFYFRTE